MVFFLPLGAVGGSLVAGAYWLTLGWLADNDQLHRAGRPHLGAARRHLIAGTVPAPRATQLRCPR